MSRIIKLEDLKSLEKALADSYKAIETAVDNNKKLKEQYKKALTSFGYQPILTWTKTRPTVPGLYIYSKGGGTTVSANAFYVHPGTNLEGNSIWDDYYFAGPVEISPYSEEPEVSTNRKITVLDDHDDS